MSRKNAKIKQHGNQSVALLDRDECVRQIRRDVRNAWKESIGYHRGSLAETAMGRMKTCFVDKLKYKTLINQITESISRCRMLNLFVTLGMPAFTWSKSARPLQRGRARDPRLVVVWQLDYASKERESVIYVLRRQTVEADTGESRPTINHVLTQLD